MAPPSKLTRTLAGLVCVGLISTTAACGKNNEDGTDAGMTEDMSSNNDTGSTGDDMGSTGEDMGSTGDDMGATGDAGTDMGSTGDAGTDAGADMGADAGGDMGADMGMASNRVVFDDAVASGLTFAPFGGSTNAVSTSTDEAATGTSSLKVAVPDSNYTGGAYVPTAAADLSNFNALRFQVKASKAASLDTVGFGNSGAEDIQQVQLKNLALTTSWQEVIIPIPDPSLATANSGLFHFAEGSDEGAYDIYFDDIEFLTVDSTVFANAAPAFDNETKTIYVGQTATPAGTVLAVDINGTATTVEVKPFYFAWTSSDTAVASVSDAGLITGLTAGTSAITGTLDGASATGQIDLTVEAGATAAAPTPTTAAGDVEASIFSDAYTDVTVNTLLASYSVASLTELQVAGNDTLVYGGLDFAAIEFTGANSLDLTASTMMHIDIWTPDAVSFSVKLVDFGPNNAYDNGGDDREAQLDFAETTDFATGQWESFDIPLSDFVTGGLEYRANVSQLILVGRVNDTNNNPVPGATVFVDNIYFY